MSLVLSGAALALPASSSGGHCDENGCWPKYFLLGAQKAATTSVFQMLDDAKMICGATHYSSSNFMYKETHFLDLYFNEDKTQYTSLYRRTDRCDGSNFMDATPNYLFDYDGPDRLQYMLPQVWLPEVKFMAILREPISRDLSIYNMVKEEWMAETVKTDVLTAGSVKNLLCKDGTTGFPSYDESVTCKVNHWNSHCNTDGQHMQAYARCAFDQENVDSGNRNRLTDGMYDAQIHRYMQRFKRHQLLILQFEDMLSNQPAYIEKIVSFLGLSRAGPMPTSIPKDNGDSFNGKVTAISCRTRHKLQELFDPWNDWLYESLRQDAHLKFRPAEEVDFPPFVAPSCEVDERQHESRARNLTAVLIERELTTSSKRKSSKGSKDATAAKGSLKP